jgi:hypothetical protein
VEGGAQPGNGIGVPGATLGLNAFDVALPLAVASLLALPLGLGREVLLVEAAHDGGEVGGAIDDVGAMSMAGKGVLGLLDEGQREAAEGTHELGLGALEAVGLVNPQ